MASDGSPWEDDPHVLKPNATKNFLDYLGIITDIISFPICILAILADLLLFIVVLKYKRLSNRHNFYMLNFAIFHACYIVSTPLFYIVLDMFYGSQLEVHWYCVWIRVENFAIGLTISFVAGYGIDAFLGKIRPSWFGRYQDRYLYLYAFLYFFHFVIYLTSATICLKRGFSNNFNFYFLTAYYFTALTVLIYLNYKQKKMENTLRLATPDGSNDSSISAATLLCFLPLFLLYNMMIIFKDVHRVEHVLWYVAFLPEYGAYISSMVTVFKLWRSNKHFRTAFRKMLRRPVLELEFQALNSRDREDEIVSKPL